MSRDCDKRLTSALSKLRETYPSGETVAKNGVLTLEMMQEAYDKIMDTPVCADFSDYRNGKFQIPIAQIPDIINYLLKIEMILRGKKQALIVDEPYSVAASMIFEDEVNKKVGFNVQVFTTERAALKWLSCQ